MDSNPNRPFVRLRTASSGVWGTYVSLPLTLHFNHCSLQKSAQCYSADVCVCVVRGADAPPPSVSVLEPPGGCVDLTSSKQNDKPNAVSQAATCS